MLRSCLILVGVLIGNRAVAEELKLAPRHVAVTGTAIARVQPDTVVWRVNIRRTDKELSKAHTECEAAVKKVLAFATELKLAPEDMQTSYLSVQKIYDRDPAGNQTSFRHFLVERSITLRDRDTSRFDKVLNRLMQVADLEASYSLESSKYHEFRAQTRLEAVKAARQKAGAMTDLLGGKLGRVLRIAEPVETWGQAQFANNFAFGGARQPEADETPGSFAPGAIEVRVSIEVAFEIE